MLNFTYKIENNFILKKNKYKNKNILSGKMCILITFLFSYGTNTITKQYKIIQICH